MRWLYARRHGVLGLSGAQATPHGPPVIPYRRAEGDSRALQRTSRAASPHVGRVDTCGVGIDIRRPRTRRNAIRHGHAAPHTAKTALPPSGHTYLRWRGGNATRAGQDSLDARLDVRDRGRRPGWADAQKRAAGVGLESQRGLPTHSCVIYGVGQV